MAGGMAVADLVGEREAPRTVDGEAGIGDCGRLKGDARGELNEIGFEGAGGCDWDVLIDV